MAEVQNPWLSLAGDDTLWPSGLSAESARKAILEELSGGAIAVAHEEANESAVFRSLTIGARNFLIPHRHRALVDFFLRGTPGSRGSTQSDALRLLGQGRHLLLTGGPGTGKSFTLASYISALKPREGKPLRVAVAAPTGKAAARFKYLEKTPGAWIECSTLHRLLGLSQDERFFRYHRQNPLPYDILILDEISMLDLGMFSATVRALPNHAQLVLAGDPDQLPAIDGLPVDRAISFLSAENLISHVHLTEVQRFSAGKAAAYRRIAADGMRALTDSAVAGIMQHVRVRGASELADFTERYCREKICSAEAMELRRAFAGLTAGNNPPPELVAAAFGFLRNQVILSERREGPLGSTALNKRVAAEVAQVLRSPDRTLEPVMNTMNDYDLQLYNGDVGFILENAAGRSAVFSLPEGGFRILPWAGLRRTESAYAMTIHKSQGSEYENVFIICSANADNRMLYTAVTRARNEVTVLEMI